MKRVAILLLSILWSLSSWAQYVPQAFSYQAVAQDEKGMPIANEEVVVELSVFSGSPTGTLAWQEVHYPQTNDYGLFSINIGKGQSTYAGSETRFANIQWTDGPHFVRVRVDFGHSEVLNSFVDLGSVELQSVPYALVADSALKAPLPRLSQLTDVDAATVQTGQVLVWSGTRWQAGAGFDGTQYLRHDGTTDLSANWNIANNSITLGAGNLSLTNGTLSAKTLTLAGTSISSVSADATLATASNNSLATSLATKTYIDGKLAAGGSGWIVTPTALYTDTKQVGVGIAPAYPFHASIGNKSFWVQGDTSGISPNVDPGTYMLFLAGKGAFRAGSINESDMWDDAAVGMFSQAFGKNNRAKNKASAAFGENNYVASNQGVAFGLSNNITGHRSMALGYENDIKGESSLSLGYSNQNNGLQSLSLGNNNNINGEDCLAMGRNNLAGDLNVGYFPVSAFVGGIQSKAKADYCIAYGNNAAVDGNATGSVAFGLQTYAFGKYSFVQGEGTSSNNYLHAVFGRYNVITSANPSAWPATLDQEVFTVGNGLSADPADQSNALTVYQNGNVTVAGTLTQNSDQRLKKDIRPIDNSLLRLRQTQGVAYYWDRTQPRAKSAASELQYGVVAQDIERLFPNLVHTDAAGYKTVNYVGLVPVLIEALKEQQTTIDALQQQHASDRAQSEQLQQQYNALNERVLQIEKLLKTTSEK